MAYLNGTTVSITGDNLIDSMTNGYKWNLGANRTIDWSLSDGVNGEFWNDPNYSQGWIEYAFDALERYIDVDFNYLGYYGSPTSARSSGADINFAWDANNVHFTNNAQWAKGYFPQPNVLNRGDVYFNINSEFNDLPSYGRGSQGLFVITHELMHTMGLKHPHDDGGTGRPTFDGLGWQDLDVDLYSVMSYNDDDFTNSAYDPESPMVLDVLALQYLYGASTTTSTGNSTWTFERNDVYNTLYDSSGTDTVDQSGATEGWYIVLPNLILSDLIKTKVGLVISQADNDMAVPTDLSWLAGDFENAIGSRYSDDIYGNRLANSLKGGSGQDEMRGGGNKDKLFGQNGKDALFGGAGDDILNGGNKNDKLTGGSGEDRFIFKTGGDVDTITDFDAKGRVHDVLDLRGLNSIKGWQDLKNNHLEKDGPDVVIDGHHGDRIVLEDVTMGSLDKGDFMF